MKLCLCTLNVNDFLNKNVRDSFKDACYRWNFDYYEISKTFQPFDVCFNKFYIPLQVKDYDFMMYIDADAIIMKSCPNPFLTFNNDKFNAVKDDCNELELAKYRYKYEPYHLITRYFKKNNLDLEKFSENFFNAGVWFSKPNIVIPIFNKIVEILENVPDNFDDYIKNKLKNGILGSIEQALLNYDIICNDLFNSINYIWNDRKYLKNSYIYHFTGIVFKKEDIINFDWKNG